MIKNNKIPNAMEFTSFSKASDISDEDFIMAVMKFENDFLKPQPEVIFHCLVRNLKGEYAQLLFAKNMDEIQKITSNFMEHPASKLLMESVDQQSVKMYKHTILKKEFIIPDDFNCIEHGTFNIKKDTRFLKKEILAISSKIETEYLNTFDNSLAHFMGELSHETYSEISFGKTLGKTREICYGYLGIDVGKELLGLYDPESVDLDFWYLIA